MFCRFFVFFMLVLVGFFKFWKAEVAEAPGSVVGAAGAGPAPEPGPAPGIPAAGGSHGNHGLGEHQEDGSNFL